MAICKPKSIHFTQKETSGLFLNCPYLVLSVWAISCIPEYFPDPSAVIVAGVSRSDFSEAAAGNSILLGIMTSGTGTFESQEHSIIKGKVTLFSIMQQY